MALQLPTRHDSEQDEFYVPDEGIYRLVFVGYDTPIQSSFKDKATNEYGTRIRLTYAVDDPEDEAHETELTRWRNFDMDANRKASLYHDLKALNGGEEPDKPSLDAYKGAHCMGTVEHTIKPSKNDPSRMLTFANVVDVKPLKKKRKAAASMPAGVPDGDEEEQEPAATGSRKRSAFDVEDE